MELFLSILRKKRISFIGAAIVLPVMTFAVTRFHIAATDAQIKETLNALEVFYPFFASLFVCCIIPRMTEAELIVLSGSSLTLAALYEFVVYFAISLVSGEIAGIFHLPAWALPQFALSYPVTLLCVFALALLVRFAVNNVYANLGVQTAAFMLVYLNSGLAPDVVITRALTKRDLFVNGYAHMIYSDELGNWYLRFGDVMLNRLLFFAIGAALFAIAILLTKQNRLYNIKH
ncbi:MAG: hypothetical protein IKZ81_00120 [Clostridia bacterium]|nr:hypothetical protein [Clostridia bacterium]